MPPASRRHADDRPSTPTAPRPPVGAPAEAELPGGPGTRVPPARPQGQPPGLEDGLFALLSHELRTPLASIVGYLELLLDDDGQGLSAQQRRFLEAIGRNTRRLERLAARLASGELALAPGEAALVAESVEAARPRADAERDAATAGRGAALERCEQTRQEVRP